MQKFSLIMFMHKCFCFLCSYIWIYWFSDMSTCSVFIFLKEINRKWTQQVHLQNGTWELLFFVRVHVFICTVILGWISMAWMFKRQKDERDWPYRHWPAVLNLAFLYILSSQVVSPNLYSLEAQQFHKVFQVLYLLSSYVEPAPAASCCLQTLIPVLWKGY